MYIFHCICIVKNAPSPSYSHLKQGRKRPLDTPKRMIKRREREGKREKERQKERYREGGRDKRERERRREREGQREGKRGREREVKGREGQWGEKRAAHGPSLRVNTREIS